MTQFAEREWVCRKSQPRRLGMVNTSGEQVSVVQFGSSGPFENVRNEDLERASVADRKRLGYWGIG